MVQFSEKTIGVSGTTSGDRHSSVRSGSLSVRARICRRACAFLIFLAMGVWAAPASAMDRDKPRLYVYLPSNIRPYVIQQRLQQYCPGLAITVFGHHREFGEAIINASPEAILALKPVVEQDIYSTYVPVLYATKGGKRTENLVLLSVGQMIESDRFSNIAIGVVDILGRGKMKQFLGDIMNINEPNIKPVSRFEDLLSLLQVKEADAILVQSDMVDSYFNSRSMMDLKTTELDDEKARMGLAVLALRTDTPDALRSQLAGQLVNEEPALQALLERLGVERWEKP